MSTRYFLSGSCPKCRRHYDDVYYAPTCGIVEWQCQCGHVIDLEKVERAVEEVCKRLGTEEVIEELDNLGIRFE